MSVGETIMLGEKKALQILSTAWVSNFWPWDHFWAENPPQLAQYEMSVTFKFLL